MTAFIKHKTKCVCDKRMEIFSGFERWTILNKGMIIPLCGACSNKVKKYINSLQPHGK